MNEHTDPILQVESLKVIFEGNYGAVKAVNDVSFSIRKGESVALVGESGCGKSVTALSIMGLLATRGKKTTQGKILFKGENLLKNTEQKMLKLRGEQIGMIFQDPMTSLNPLMRIGDQIAEVMVIHWKLKRREALEKAIALIRAVGIPHPEEIARDFPHQLSGGMRQRIMIAIAMACEPDMLIADEPTTALDVTIQAQILALIDRLIKEKGMSLLLITHDLGIVAESCERVMVMYAGRIVETASTKELFEHPQHPYTLGLMRAIPRLNEETDRLYSIPGTVPTNINMPDGCTFAPRCAHICERCMHEMPPLKEVMPGHFARCWLVQQDRAGIQNDTEA